MGKGNGLHRLKSKIEEKYGKGYKIESEFKGMRKPVTLKHDCGYGWEMVADTVYTTKKPVLCPECNKLYKSKVNYYKSFYDKYGKEEFEIVEGTYTIRKEDVSVLHKKCGRIIVRLAEYNVHRDYDKYNMCEHCQSMRKEAYRLNELEDKLTKYKNKKDFVLVSTDIKGFTLRHKECGKEFYRYINILESKRDVLICGISECKDKYWENNRKEQVSGKKSIEKQLEESDKKAVLKLTLRLKEYYNQVVRDYNTYIDKKYKGIEYKNVMYKEQLKGTSHLKDITGMKFGMLTAMSYIGKYKNSGKAGWRCLCDCGEIYVIDVGSLSSGHTTTCGCMGREKVLRFTMDGEDCIRTDLTGGRVGKLVVKRVVEHDINAKQTKWLTKCDCGNDYIASQQALMGETTLNCGCIRWADLTGQKFGKLTALKIDWDKTKEFGDTAWKWKCECGNIKSIRYSNVIYGGTHSCGCVGRSYGEELVKEVLDKHEITYEEEYKFDDLKDKGFLRYDFALLDKKDEVIELIEFDGRQHFIDGSFGGSYLEEIQHRDNLKNEYCKKNNIPLTRIPYTQIAYVTEIVEKVLLKNGLI